MTSRSMAGRSTISGVVAGWQPPTPSLSSPKKAAPGTLLLPQGGRTQWGKATIREFPHSLLPWRGRATLGEKESLVPPSGPPTRPGRGVPWGNSACGQTRESRSDPGGPLRDRDPHISQELSVALCLLPGPCPAVSRLGTTSQSHLHRSPSASPELTQPVHSAPLKPRRPPQCPCPPRPSPSAPQPLPRPSPRAPQSSLSPQPSTTAPLQPRLDPPHSLLAPRDPAPAPSVPNVQSELAPPRPVLGSPASHGPPRALPLPVAVPSARAPAPAARRGARARTPLEARLTSSIFCTIAASCPSSSSSSLSCTSDSPAKRASLPAPAIPDSRPPPPLPPPPSPADRKRRPQAPPPAGGHVTPALGRDVIAARAGGRDAARCLPPAGRRLGVMSPRSLGAPKRRGRGLGRAGDAATGGDDVTGAQEAAP